MRVCFVSVGEHDWARRVNPEGDACPVKRPTIRDESRHYVLLSRSVPTTADWGHLGQHWPAWSGWARPPQLPLPALWTACWSGSTAGWEGSSRATSLLRPSFLPGASHRRPYSSSSIQMSAAGIRRLHRLLLPFELLVLWIRSLVLPQHAHRPCNCCDNTPMDPIMSH